MNRNPIGQKALSLLLSLTLILSIFGVDTAGAFAARSGNAARAVLSLDSGNILITDSGYFDSGESQVKAPPAGGYLITQNSVITPNTISVTGSGGCTQDITIENVNIDVSAKDNTCAFSIAKGAAVNLTLEGTNTLKSGDYRAGLEVPGSYPGDTTKSASLTVTDTSTGSLNATGNDGAGIGGGYNEAGGTITVTGGTVTATGNNGAGIGGAGGTVTIFDPNTQVTAKGQGGGRDIGSGDSSTDGGSLIVSGSATVAMLNTGTNAVNPDTNRTPPKYTDCQIVFGNIEEKYDSMGNVSSTKPVLFLDDGSIAISRQGYSVNGGTEVPYSSDYLIIQKSSGTISKTISVQSGTHNIAIRNINVDVHGTNNDCAFSIAPSSKVNLTLEGQNTLRSGDYRAGLEVPGDNSNPPDTTGNAFLTITGQNSDSLIANGGDCGAGIGGGQGDSGGTIAITGGDVTTTGGQHAEGIGGGSVSGGGGAGGDVTISGTGTQVIAEGQDGGKDIGSGDGGNDGGTLSVSGDNAEPDPDTGLKVDLKSAGINAKMPGGTAHQFTNCKIFDTGAVDKNNKDISGSYDADGKIRLGTVLTVAPNKAVFGNPVTLSATNIIRVGFGDTPTLSGKLSFFCDGTPIGNPVSIGASSAEWTPSDAAAHQLTARYQAASGENYTMDPQDASLSYSAAAPQNNSGESSHGTTAPSLPSSVTDTSTSTTIDLSGATFPAWVTGVSLSVTPEAANGAPSAPGNTGIPSDPQGAAVYHLVLTQMGLNLIGSPFVYNIQLLDQNGNPITYFTGTVTVKVAIPAGIHGTPHIFRYEESTGTFTDLGATVENGFLVFKTTHFSYYVIAGTGDSVTLDTKNYQLPVGGKYQIGVRLTGSKAKSVKVYSTNNKAVIAARLKNGNVQVTGKRPGTAYIMIDVYDSKNHLLTHSSVRIDVKTGIRPRGDSTRQIGAF